MSGELIPLSHCATAKRQDNLPLAFHAGHYYCADRFYAAVRHWVNLLQSQPFERYTLYTDDAYPFAVMLFALFHAGKEVWIPGNNRPGTAQQLQQQKCRLIGDWDKTQAFDYCLDSADYFNPAFLPLNSDTKLVIFTSGSTGQPKPIEKRLIQFQREIALLEKLWGKQLAAAAALSTVSHQHIYGLLFRVLWPLSAERCFHSRSYIDPELLADAIQDTPAYWIASPAHLKRLDRNSPWQTISALNAIFSSGGPLQYSTAQQILANSGQSVIEVFGSSESGGIAWRQQNRKPDTAWTLFEGMTLSCKDDRWHLHSPLAGKSGLPLDDQLDLQHDGRFFLQGRVDRIVKLEGKRVSLTELEQRLMDTQLIAEAFTVMIAKNRDEIGAVCVLNQKGLAQLKASGRNQLIKEIRIALYKWFEAVVLPRKWLFVDRLPLNAQGKIDQHILMQLLDGNYRKFPQVLGFEMTCDSIELMVKVPHKLIYFADHFSGYPILPGVVQIAWADYFGRLFFAIDEPFLNMEVIKFVKVIQPEDELKLTLDWKKDIGKLYFNFSSEAGMHSSGLLLSR
ncbi:Acyl-coenzyme A synthetase/AMP-(Fatty) acid ligase [Candidatus Methylobacter favarea]|uniref:Acyl-coenzyme A synthetase/AMP-(Fatty) acid ligase n=1 Tax=Candidatus Methylobacter favarea TaxID=2707345 RepID=A0A8S0WKE6_9GAMM|nr:AMP-binding protein [Candidatus Methylobacter favarea]CAA9891910.1 Acyl-coenzyme A synthetase/AMP-(Fatty) acid ligase [Candidatus Methylobacter favarea]